MNDTDASSDGAASTVELRAVEEAHLPILFEQQLDPEATEMAAFPPRDRDAFMAHWSKILADNGPATRTILLDGSVAGYICSFDITGEREVGYWIGREHWGKGVATRALQIFLDEQRNRPLYAHVAKHNVGSIRVLEKCGFEVVGEDKTTVRGVDRDDLVMMLPR
jgi:RimJ/RimL family protein N-acetyltransferase